MDNESDSGDEDGPDLLLSKDKPLLDINIKDLNKVKKIYPMKLTPYYRNLIKQKEDSIYKQCIPDIKELYDVKNSEDPLKEEENTPVPYLIHKYPDRVLLLASNTCAMYCRFCTRKRKVGRVKQILLEDIFRAIEYIEEHKEIRDVIVSGGDPLLRKDSEIDSILSKIRNIPHIEIIRIGTRVPCVLPSRITKRLVNILKRYHPLYVNIHFNHPSEITPEAEKACGMLADAGIPLGSQTVLLKGVNDDVNIMKDLMHKLLKIRVKPYYIYQCDDVKGVEHFKTNFEKGIEIMKGLQGFTSGLAVPKFVIDGPGGKIPADPNYIKKLNNYEIEVCNYKDEKFILKNPI